MSTYTADLKDSSSNSIRPITDWSAVQNAPDFASQIQAVTDIANNKIDKGSAAAYNSTVIDGTVDFNTITTQGFFTVNAGNGHNAGTHWPASANAADTNGEWGMLLQWGHTSSTSLGVQLLVLVPGLVFVRSYDGSNGGYWEDWKKLSYTTTP